MRDIQEVKEKNLVANWLWEMSEEEEVQCKNIAVNPMYLKIRNVVLNIGANFKDSLSCL